MTSPLSFNLPGKKKKNSVDLSKNNLQLLQPFSRRKLIIKKKYMIDLEDESKERKRNIKQVDHFCDFF